jgi:Arc/MetJ-type ribon-helix-helix transcriptional regulator
VKARYAFTVLTHYVSERAGYAGCATGSNAGEYGSLLDAVRAAVKELEDVPEWDGRGPKLLLVTDSKGRTVFEARRNGEWTQAASRQALKRAEHINALRML